MGVPAHDKLKNSSVAQIVIETAASREDTQAFAWASHALNNSFFLEHLVHALSSLRPRIH
jgi:hypothetical protein